MTTAVFWTVATVMVVLSSAAVVVPIFWVRPAEGAAFGRRRLLAMLALAAAIPLSALGVYSLLGSPALVGEARA